MTAEATRALYALLVAAVGLERLVERWSTRLVVVPGAPAVATGPYRFLPRWPAAR